MPVLSGLLPQPKYASVERFDPKDFEFDQNKQRKFKEPPLYLQRQGFKPRVPEDFGDGGAFPEIHVLQYPLNMGRKDRAADTVTPLRVDARGNVRYDVVVHQGVRRGKKVFTQLADLVEKDDSDDDLTKPSEDEVQKLAEKTQEAMGKLVTKKMMSARPTHIDEQEKNEPVFIRYTPSQAKNDAHNSGARQRIIKLQEIPKDPLEPPKFRVKKLPPRPPSPPVPVMHSPPRKITAEDQANWKIPPCISNWKNIKGYTIPLDKRLAADGRGLKEVQVNDKFATLSEALYIAERNARDEISLRAQMMKTRMQGIKAQKEEQYRKLAMAARKEATAHAEEEEEEDVEARDSRDKLRRERRREIKRDLRMEARMGEESRIKKGGTKSGFGRDDDRDISEKIALGQNVQQSRDAMFDQRLFNQDAGLSNGFGAEDDYNVYSKPLMSGSSASQLYRPPKDLQKEVNADREMKSILETGTSRFKPDRGFKGASDQVASSHRAKPVEFEKDKADPYGLGQFMSSVKEKKKNALDGIGKQGFMKASGGSSSRDKEDFSGVHPDRMKNMKFREAESSSSSRKRDRDDDRDRDRDRRRRRDDDDNDRDRRRRR